MNEKYELAVQHSVIADGFLHFGGATHHLLTSFLHDFLTFRQSERFTTMAQTRWVATQLDIQTFSRSRGVYIKISFRHDSQSISFLLISSRRTTRFKASYFLLIVTLTKLRQLLNPEIRHRWVGCHGCSNYLCSLLQQ